MSAAHTPGAWHAVAARVEHGDDSVADICNCNPESMMQGHIGRSYEEQCANATLIAAAPALLAALEAMRDAVTSIVDYCGTSWYVLAADRGAAWAGPFGTPVDADNACDRLIADAAVNASAAIAQARGEQ